MKYNLDKRVEDDIIRIAKKNGVKKIILFGSRARRFRIARTIYSRRADWHCGTV